MLTGFVLARASAGLVNSTIRNDTNHLELIRGWFGRPALAEGSGVGKDERRLYTCPQCNGSQVVVKWKRAEVDEEQEIATTELCPTCDGSGQILGPST